jgi:hypothetical protein
MIAQFHTSASEQAEHVEQEKKHGEQRKQEVVGEFGGTAQQVVVVDLVPYTLPSCRKLSPPRFQIELICCFVVRLDGVIAKMGLDSTEQAGLPLQAASASPAGIGCSQMYAT